MSTELTNNKNKSRWAWIEATFEVVGMSVVCGLVGFVVATAFVTVGDTILTTRSNAIRVIELEKRLQTLETQARAQVTESPSSYGTALSRRPPEVRKY